MNSLHDNSGTASCGRSVKRMFMNRFYHLLIRQILDVFLLVAFQKLIKNLSFFQAPMPDGRQYRIPVPKPIFVQDGVYIRRLGKKADLKFFCLGMSGEKLFPPSALF